jgi:membrane protein DedA with SNARE-associated domain
MIEYILFFIGIVFLGDIMFLPLVYLASVKSLDLKSVLAVAFLANLASDYGWYWIGSKLNKDKVYDFFKIKKFEEKNPELIASFEKHAGSLVLYSKFAYGLRVPIRILYGIHRLSLKDYMVINTISALIWLAGIWILATGLSIGLVELKRMVWGGEIAILSFGLVTVGIYYMSKFIAKKTLRVRGE